MYDAAPLQVIAHGTCGGFVPLTQTCTGAKVTRNLAGNYNIDLDPGLPGDVAVDPNHSRIFVQPISGPAGTNAQVSKNSPTQFVVVTQVLAGASADTSFDFVIYRDAGNKP